MFEILREEAKPVVTKRRNISLNNNINHRWKHFWKIRTQGIFMREKNPQIFKHMICDKIEFFDCDFDWWNQLIFRDENEFENWNFSKVIAVLKFSDYQVFETRYFHWPVLSWGEGFHWEIDDRIRTCRYQELCVWIHS